MRGTKLWTEPRSPLISGRSRRARSFSVDWLIGSALALGGSGMVIAYLLLPNGIDGVSEPGTSALIIATAAFSGAALGVLMARGMGWIRPWLSAAIVGMLGCLGWTAFLAFGTGV